MTTQKQKDLNAIDKSILELQSQLKVAPNEQEHAETWNIIDRNLEIRTTILINRYEELSSDQIKLLNLIRKTFG
ncbi:MAG: hypothetical protein AB8G05_18585 [Oligoflexales bacterium]